MTIPIRLAPSGPVVATFGKGAQLRMEDTTSVMTGSLAVPLVADLICPDGFGQTDAIVLTLATPAAGNLYGAQIEMDVSNASTNAACEVVLYLDVSVDGGANYVNVCKNNHHLGVVANNGGSPPVAIGVFGRPVTLHLKQTLGSALGVVDGTTPSLKLRARASAPDNTGAQCQVDSAAASGGTSVTGLNGTIYMALRESVGAV